MTDQLWQCGKPIETAPKDRLIRVWAPARDGLKAMFSLCQWHPDAGFCIDELRVPEIWWELEDESWIPMAVANALEALREERDEAIRQRDAEKQVTYDRAAGVNGPHILVHRQMWDQLREERDAAIKQVEEQRHPCPCGKDTASIKWARCYSCRQQEKEVSLHHIEELELELRDLRGVE